MSPKQKNIALVAGFVVSLVICYKLAISNTLEQKEEYETLKAESVMFNNVPKQLSLLRQKEHYYDSLLSKYRLDGSSIQNNLLETITSFCDTNNIDVKQFLEPHVTKTNDLSIKSYSFVLEGNFNAILKLVHHLEQKTKFGEITNLHFEKKKNYRTGKHYLEARVILRSFG